mmetsp:Transcript_2293/g.3320  ORF Transcript_2293/g.3320 Transcript_2293/m.3320 type:complete len:483 (-) Transcript_2293:54-1502(-)
MDIKLTEEQKERMRANRERALAIQRERKRKLEEKTNAGGSMVDGRGNLEHDDDKKKGNDGKKMKGSDDDDDDDEGDEEEEEDDDDDDDDEDEDEEEDGLQDEEMEQNSSTFKPLHVEEGCSFDLRNLVSTNSHQVDTSELYNKKSTHADGQKYTISNDLGVPVNEEYLLEKARDGCAKLLTALFELPVERSDAGPKGLLPAHFEIKTPRSLPPPAAKKETRWEKFAKERGIAVNKKKRESKVWDETTGTWMYRHGYKKANSDSTEWPIMEVKKNDDPYADPWLKARDAKRDRVDKNIENQMRNKERAGLLSKGTTTRALKDKKKARDEGREGGKKGNVIPSGVPIDLREKSTSSEKRGMSLTKSALFATQRSTASLGKFDAMRDGEPERKKAFEKSKKRKFESSTDKRVISTESDRSMKVLDKVLKGGGAKGEKEKRKGKLAKGETAYDYEFDDGLGPSTFRKKKGRAANGKMRKVTKKRIK